MKQLPPNLIYAQAQAPPDKRSSLFTTPASKRKAYHVPEIGYGTKKNKIHRRPQLSRAEIMQIFKLLEQYILSEYQIASEVNRSQTTISRYTHMYKDINVGTPPEEVEGLRFYGVAKCRDTPFSVFTDDDNVMNDRSKMIIDLRIMKKK